MYVHKKSEAVPPSPHDSIWEQNICFVPKVNVHTHENSQTIYYSSTTKLTEETNLSTHVPFHRASQLTLTPVHFTSCIERSRWFSELRHTVCIPQEPRTTHLFAYTPYKIRYSYYYCVEYQICTHLQLSISKRTHRCQGRSKLIGSQFPTHDRISNNTTQETALSAGVCDKPDVHGIFSHLLHGGGRW